MLLSAKSRYGLRALFDMAYHAGSMPAQIKDISRRQEISPRYLEQIFQDLKKAGILKSRRGPQGGYQPGGVIPIHNHFYIQTMHILSGRFECYQFDPQTDQKTKSCVAAAGDTVVVPSMEPHGMRNMSDTEPATFLCCICNVYEKEAL